MACKKPVRLHICGPGGCYETRGWLHPRGCMGARYPHIDVEARGVLAEVARKKGFHARCWGERGAITLVLDRLGLEVRIEAVDARLRCGRRVYIMATRSGLIYISPVEALG